MLFYRLSPHRRLRTSSEPSSEPTQASTEAPTELNGLRTEISSQTPHFVGRLPTVTVHSRHRRRRACARWCPRRLYRPPSHHRPYHSPSFQSAISSWSSSVLVKTLSFPNPYPSQFLLPQTRKRPFHAFGLAPATFPASQVSKSKPSTQTSPSSSCSVSSAFQHLHQPYPFCI